MNRKATIKKKMGTTMREETTMRETTTMYYSKMTETYDEEERGVVVEGVEIRVHGEEDDEEEMFSNQH